MGKIAFVFSGQGDQFPGMGKQLYDRYPEARAVFEVCDGIRPLTSHQCFYGTDEELKETVNTQPCLFAAELAAAGVLTASGIVPDEVAGFSLGEVAACAFSGMLDMRDAFSLVCKRGEFMQKAADEQDLFMAAVLKLSNDDVLRLCAERDWVYAVNFNCPGQVSVSGLAAEKQSFFESVKAAGGRVVPLNVKGGFHSPFMNEAAEKFKRELDEISIRKAKYVVYSDMTARPYGDNAKELLSSQICSPVLWENIILNMISSGTDTFIETGPGRTLANMIKRIDGGVRVYSMCDFPAFLAEVKGC